MENFKTRLLRHSQRKRENNHCNWNEVAYIRGVTNPGKSECVCVWEFYFTKHLLFLINILKINTWEIFCCLSKTPNTQLLPSPKNITNIHQKGPFSMLIIKISDVTCICEERDLTQNSLELVILSSEINTF